MNRIKIISTALSAVSLVLIGTSAEGIETTRMRSYDFMYRVEATMTPDKPKVGDIVTINWRVFIDRDIPLNGQARPTISVKRGVELIGSIKPDQNVKLPLYKGDIKEFSARFKCNASSIKAISSSAKARYVHISVGFQSFDDVNKRGLGGSGYELFLIDSLTGLLGTRNELLSALYGELSSPRVFMLYNHLEGDWLKEPDQGYALTNKKIAEEIKKFEPSLSDSEALCLHADNFKLIINAIGNPTASDEERIKKLLSAGWLKAIRGGSLEKEKWQKEFMKKNKGNWEEGGLDPKFFRANGNSDFSSNRSNSKMVTTFIGNWSYQDHLYDKDNGLQFAYNTKPVKNAEVGIRANWFGQGAVFVGWGMTDNSGNFNITTSLIPDGATSVKAFPILYTWGPSQFNEAIKVSDPVSSTISTLRNPRDTTIWFLERSDGPPGNSLVVGDICNFGICYPETATATRLQPRSGAVNIYQTLLHANSFSHLPSRNLRVLWEPNYSVGTGYSITLDTLLYIQGRTMDSDEWDDDHIYHEYGHFLMDYYAGIDSFQENNYNKSHLWNVADTSKWATAWIEGWADYFSGRARVGSGTDSLYVNNSGVIGSDPEPDSGYYYYNLENPWEHNFTNPSGFQASEYTVGSVAGILWDIYDPYNENPYLADPTRRDIINRGDDEIWNLMDNYDPYGPPNHIWSIRHFRTGWRQYNYGDESEVTSIYAHHGVLDYLPPTSLNATQPTGTLHAQLDWQPPVSKTSKSYVGYNIYRKSSTDTIYTLINTEAITDTFYPDYTVAMEGFYNYYVVTTDSFGYESIPSNVASIYINPLQHSNSPLATAYNNASKLVCDTTGANLHLVYQSNDKIWYTHSPDSGNTWSADTAIGEGQYPAIALDKDEMPNVVWSKKINIKDCNLYFSKYNSAAGWSNPYILGTFHMPRVTDLVSQVVPGFAIGKADTGFITWLASPDVVNVPLFDVTYGGWFSTNDASPYLNYTALDSVNILAYKCPTVAVDTIGAAHFAWDAKPASYYAIGYRKRDASGTITPAENISEGGENESPCLNFSRWQNSIDGIWVGPFSPLVSTRSILDTAQNWGLISCVDSSAVQPVVVAGGYAAYSKNNEIYVKRKVGNLWPDSTEKNISNTASSSNYPQACFSQTVGGSNFFVAWTEGDAAPYQIKFAKIAVPAVAKIYADIGGVDLSPYCIQRAGYKIFGTEPYKTVDYHPQRLIYKFGGFNKNKKYSIEMVYYYQDQNEAAEKDAKGGNRKYWMQKLNIDGACKEMTKLISGQRIVVKKPIPPAAYNKDGEVLVYIDKVSGDYAVCAEIFLYEFDKDCEDCNDVKTSQLALSTPIGLPLTTAVYQNAPNPFGQMTNIKYQIAKSGVVSLKVYNIAGQLVKTLANGNHTPGHYSANWDGKVEKGAKAASGIYIYRIQAGEYVNTKKLVILK